MERRCLDTGTRTRAGRIGVSLASIMVERTRLESSVGQIVRIFGGLAAIVCSSLIIFYGVYRDDWLQGVLSGIALAMGMLPEEFPVVVTIFLAIGAWRLAYQGPDKPARRRRDSGRSNRYVRGQDRNADGKSDANPAPGHLSGSFAVGPDFRDVPPAFRPLVKAAWLATRPASIDLMDQAVAGLASRTGSIKRLIGQWFVSTESSRNCWQCPSQGRMTTAVTRLPPRAHRKPSLASAHLTDEKAAGHGACSGHGGKRDACVWSRNRDDHAE